MASCSSADRPMRRMRLCASDKGFSRAKRQTRPRSQGSPGKSPPRLIAFARRSVRYLVEADLLAAAEFVPVGPDAVLAGAAADDVALAVAGVDLVGALAAVDLVEAGAA